MVASFAFVVLTNCIVGIRSLMDVLAGVICSLSYEFVVGVNLLEGFFIYSQNIT